MNWLFLALLLLSDPVGDDHGAQLGYPRAAIYQEVGFADLTGFQMRQKDGAWQLGVRLDRYPNPAAAPLGFSLAVVALYLDSQPGGSEKLPGCGLKTPAAGGWDEAYLLSGWGAEKRLPDGSGQPARAWREGDWIWLATSLRQRPRVYVASGIYDPFSPWAFRSPQPGGGYWRLDGPASAPAALDVIAADNAAVWASGVLPAAHGRHSWRLPAALALMALALFFVLRALRLKG